MSHNYNKGPCIGRGSFGKVYRGVEKDSNQVVALKLQDLESAAEEIDVIRREIQVMSEISSPYVVRYHTSFIENTTLWLVMEYMAGGSLKDMVDVVGPFAEDAIAEVMHSLCQGLAYIHRERKLHRDIKAANILLTDEGCVKLADFGVAGQMTNTLRQRNTYVGSPFWMAPEVIQRSQYDHTADIWSVGITAFELARGHPPYHDKFVLSALALIANSEPPRLDPTVHSKDFCDFVAGCLRAQPTDRMTAAELLAHPFLEKARPEALKELLNLKRGSDPRRNGDSHGAVPGDLHHDVAAAPGAADPNESNDPWDFGSGTDSAAGTVRIRQDEVFDAPGPSESDITADMGTVIEHPHVDEAEPDTGTMVERPTASRPAALSALTRKVSMGGNRASKKKPKVSASSNVLEKLCLPVLVKLRANAVEGGTESEKLATSLGALEVAFVHMEQAKKGACELFFRELMAEAGRCDSREIREIVAASMPSKFVKSKSSRR